MFEILGNIYDRTVATVFGTVVFETAFLVLFGDDGNLFFEEKFSRSYIDAFFLSKKHQNWF